MSEFKLLSKTSQSVNHIKDLIEGGTLKPGDQLLPSIKLAAKLGVSLITIRRCLAELAKEGLVYSVQGKGTFVTEVSTGKSSGFSTLNLVYPFSREAVRSDVFLGPVVDGLCARLAESSLRLRLFPLFDGCSMADAFSTDEAARTLASGVVVVNYNLGQEDVRALIRLKSPVVVIGPRQCAGGFPYVNVDHFAAGYEAAAHLIRDHKRGRIALINGKLRSQLHCQELRAGYKKALRDNGLRYDGSLVAHMPEEEGDVIVSSMTMLTEMLGKGIRFDGLISYGDHSTMGVLEALKARGLAVPGDVALISYNDFPLVSEYFTQTLSAVR